VALVTSGPGVTNAVTGLSTAYMDSIPMVVISGQVPSHAIGQDAFQECDTVGITRPVVKHNFLVKDVKDLAETDQESLLHRPHRPSRPRAGRYPEGYLHAQNQLLVSEEVEMRSYKPVDKGHSGQIRKAVQLLLQAERPMIYTGGGVILANASPELNKLVDKLGFPVTNTLMGLGAYRASDEKFVGMPGMHGTYEANMAMQHCDVLIAIGARFDDRVIGNPKHFASNPRKIIHIDIDPSSISKRVKVDIPIVGNVKDVLIELLAQLDAAEPSRTAGAGGLVEADQRMARRDCLKYHLGPGHQAAIGGGKAVGSDQGRCLHHLRRGPAPDVGRAVLRFDKPRAGSIPAAWAPWAWACRTPWACRWPIRMRPWPASPAKARSRCASRSWRPASSIT
jgi:acetolactate synthase-1/2/3 large subunit